MGYYHVQLISLTPELGCLLRDGLIGNLSGWKISGMATFSPEGLEKESSRRVTSECLNYLKEFLELLMRDYF